MSDMPFQRPGDDSGPAPQSWPYTSPSLPPPLTPEVFRTEPAQAPPDVPTPRRRPAAGVLVAVGIAGLVVGGLAVGLVAASYYATPEPLPITVEAFPEYVLGLEREDMPVRRSGDAEALKQLDAEFENQLERFRFSHDGDGATVGYGQSLALTIVNGRQALPLPTGDDVVTGGRTLISLETDVVSCVFSPQVGLYDSAVLDAAPDLTAKGRTECVLNDSTRKLSLRLTSRVPVGATQTSQDFAKALKRTHAKLID